jgi:signal transduction histidine kinase
MAVPTSDDEVRALAIAVNQMAERLARYESEIRRSERLRALGLLGGGIAHQIRNSVTGCRLALDLHRRDARTSGNGHGTEALDVALRQLTQMETSVQRLLTLGKPAARTRAAADLADTVRDAIELVRPLAAHHGISLRGDLPPRCQIEKADAHGLTQLVVNLAVNAVEAAAQSQSSPDGSLVVPEPHVRIQLKWLAAGQWQLVIGNTGPGPSPAIQQRLFEPFATDKPGGTGLGLAVARQIADDHQGSITWRQQDGMTWFFVTLPGETNE